MQDTEQKNELKTIENFKVGECEEDLPENEKVLPDENDPEESARAAFIRTIPVFAGYIVLGIGFGLMMESHGYSLLWIALFPVFVYAGAMQYMAVELLATGANIITCAISTLMVQARHIFYGLSMIGKYREIGKVRHYLAFGMTDETYALLCRDKKHTTKYYFYVTLFNHLYWIAGCILGGIAGKLIPFELKGVDFVLTALFVTSFIEQWASVKRHSAALAGVIASLVCRIIFGRSNFMIPAMIVIMAILLLMKKKEEKYYE